MSLTAQAMRLLADYGLTLEQIIAVAEANDETPPPAAAGPSKAALRTQRWRERKASQNVTGTSPRDVTGTVTSDAKTVTEASPVTPLARAVDKPLEVIPLDAVAVAESARQGVTDDWPDMRLVVELLCQGARTSRLDHHREPGLITTAGRIMAWKNRGASWALNVEPVVVAIARKRGPPIKTWTYFDGAVAQSIADTQRPLTIPEPTHERPRQSLGESALVGKLRDVGAAMEAARQQSTG